MAEEPYQILEREYAAFTGSAHAVSCNSGTSALHLSLLALGIGPGDEVIIPDFSMAATAFAVSYCGGTHRFGDVDPDTYGLRLDEVERLTTPRTRAVVLVHTYGRISRDTASIIDYCHGKGIAVVEDACEAQGAVRASRADFTCYSFYKNKIIAAEEGGMVTTHIEVAAEMMRYLKSMAFSPEHDYYHMHVGYNYRMPNLTALAVLNSLEDYPQNDLKRREIETMYDEVLSKRRPPAKRDAVWFYEIPTRNRELVLANCKGARLPFQPISSFPIYGGKKGQGLPVSQKLGDSLVLLPVIPDMTMDEVRYNARYV